MMNQTLKRAVISAVIFAVVYLGAGLVTQMPAYDGLVKTLHVRDHCSRMLLDRIKIKPHER